MFSFLRIREEMIANCFYYQYLFWPASHRDIHPLKKQINNSLKISLFFLFPSYSLSPKQEREREIEKVKCHINKKVLPEALTLQSPENCVLAQLVHSSHIGEWAPNQSRNGEAPCGH